MAVALYARVSTTRQAEQDLSIPDQLQQMREWCAAQGAQIAVEYVEPGASAMDDRRPVFQQMIADATVDPPPFDAIIETFERARQRREGRRPTAVPPRRLSSPVLLTGLLKCGHCGSGMTLTTGKGGRYRYYKCTRRVNKGNARCPGRNRPVELLDGLVLAQLEGRVFTPAKLREILTVARRQFRERAADDRQKLARLQADLRRADERIGRLFEALESGRLPLDEIFQKRVQLAKSAREGVLVEMAGLRRLQSLPIERILPSQVEAFSKIIRAKLRDRTSSFARDYVHAVVDSIVVTDDTATISGSHTRLMQAIAGKKMGTDQVPSFVPDWRARRDSNSRPSGS